MTEPGQERGKWWTLGCVCVAIFMLLLDVTVVNVALPEIQDDLGASFSDLQWVVDAYALTLAAFLLTAGSLADRLGRRRIFVIGLAVFTVASTACGLAGSPNALNVARAVQGVGGALMLACSLSLIAQAFQGRERGTAIGIFGATLGGAVAIGPLVGGVLVEHAGWEWIFFVNVPIGIAAIVVSVTRLVESKDPQGARVDLAGVATWSAALFLLVFALVRGNAEGWGDPLIVSFLVAGTVLLVAFFAIERRTEHPMLDLELFRKPSFTGAAIVAFTLSASMFAMFLYLTLYVQNVLGFSPLEAGVRFLPITLLSFFVAPFAGKLSGRVPVRILMGAGLFLVGAGLLLMSGLDARSEWTHLLPGFFVAGVGIGMTNPALVTTQIGVVAPQRSGMASGIGNTFRQVGIATGIAGLGAVFQPLVVSKVSLVLFGSGAAQDRFEGLLAAGRIDALPPELREAAVAGFAAALNELLIIGAGVALLGSLSAFVLVRARDFVAPPGAPPPAA